MLCEIFKFNTAHKQIQKRTVASGLTKDPYNLAIYLRDLHSTSHPRVDRSHSGGIPYHNKQELFINYFSYYVYTTLSSSHSNKEKRIHSGKAKINLTWTHEIAVS